MNLNKISIWKISKFTTERTSIWVAEILFIGIDASLSTFNGLTFVDHCTIRFFGDDMNFSSVNIDISFGDNSCIGDIA